MAWYRGCPCLDMETFSVVMLGQYASADRSSVRVRMRMQMRMRRGKEAIKAAYLGPEQIPDGWNEV